MSLSTVKEAVDDIRKGKMVIVVDEEHRENEGDLTIAAEKITPEIVFLVPFSGCLLKYWLLKTLNHTHKIESLWPPLPILQYTVVWF